MALPKEPVTLSTFHGGMAPDIGQVVNGMPETAEELRNVVVEKDGSIRLRPSIISKHSSEISGLLVDTNEGYYSGVAATAVPDFFGNLYMLRTHITDAASSNIVTEQIPIAGNNLDGLAAGTPTIIGIRNLGDFRTIRFTNKCRIISDNYSNLLVYNPHITPVRIAPDTVNPGFVTFGSDAVARIRSGGGGSIQDLFPADFTVRRFSGGLFYGGRHLAFGDGRSRNSLYVSQIMTLGSTAYMDFFIDDPLVPKETDGGVITISAIDKIYGLAPYRNGVAIIASNGVWLLTSTQAGAFNPLQFSINQLTKTGCIGEDAWTLVEDNLVYLTQSGMVALTLHESGELITQPIGTGRIDKQFQNISLFHKKAAGIVYDSAERRIYISINDPSLQLPGATGNDLPIDPVERKRNPNAMFAHNRHMYVYDLDLGAWWAYTIEDGHDTEITNGSWGVFGSVTIPGRHSDPYQENPERDYVVWLLQRSRQESLSTTHRFAAAVFAQRTPPGDLAGLIVSGSPKIRARVLSHPHTLDNLTNKKLIHFLHMALGRVEVGVLSGGVDLNPGALTLTIGWDWFRPGESSHPKASARRRLYKPYKYTETTFGGVDKRKLIVKDKLKLPGRGTAVQLLLQNYDLSPSGTLDVSTVGRDFHLAGWQLEIKGDRRR